jgi:hypothetical protein
LNLPAHNSTRKMIASSPGIGLTLIVADRLGAILLPDFTLPSELDKADSDDVIVELNRKTRNAGIWPTMSALRWRPARLRRRWSTRCRSSTARPSFSTARPTFAGSTRQPAGRICAQRAALRWHTCSRPGSKNGHDHRRRRKPQLHALYTAHPLPRLCMHRVGRELKTARQPPLSRYRT